MHPTQSILILNHFDSSQGSGQCVIPQEPFKVRNLPDYWIVQLISLEFLVRDRLSSSSITTDAASDDVGSCWALGIMYSGVAGSPYPADVIEHIKRRVHIPYLDTSTLDMLITSPTNKV